MRNIINIALIAICITFVKPFSSNAKAAEDIAKKAKQNFPKYSIIKNFDDVSQDKVFTISFSRDIDEYTINENAIKILDLNMKKVPIDIGFTSTSKVEIVPKRNLECGQTYLLVIEDKIKNRFSRNIKQGVMCTIKVEDDKNIENELIKETIDSNSVNTETTQIIKNEYTKQSVGIKADEANMFIEKIVPGAVRTYKKYNILPSITIAQAILESGWGKSDKSVNFKNLFGIKADSKWLGKVAEAPTKEFIDGKYIVENSSWRVYDNWDESIEDHGCFIYSRPWYSQAGVFEAKSYKEQIEAIKKAGYATDPKYVDKICCIIEKYNLDKYDI